MDELVRSSLAPTRLTLALMSGFGGIALLLAAVGLYGVLSYAVGSRTREIGVRMALGQEPRDARLQVLLEAGRVVALAVVIGLALAAGLGRSIAGLLYEVPTLDPPSYVTAALLVVGVSIVACWIPARRATRVDPLTALRE